VKYIQRFLSGAGIMFAAFFIGACVYSLLLLAIQYPFETVGVLGVAFCAYMVGWGIEIDRESREIDKETERLKKEKERLDNQLRISQHGV
jgi:membrane protein implicated in regulation of membrane protease activity